jgi:hypothetical protein
MANEQEKPKKATKTEIIKSRGGSTDKVNSKLKNEIEYIQKGVTDGKGNKGSYVWYKGGRTIDGKPNRDMVYDENMSTVYKSPEGRKYEEKRKKMK